MFAKNLALVWVGIIFVVYYYFFGHLNNKWVGFFLKPIPVWTYSCVLFIMRNHWGRQNLEWVTGVAFGFLFDGFGDVFLALKGIPFSFVLGLTAFLIAHCFRISAYWRRQYKEDPVPLRPYLLIIPTIIGIGFYIYLLTHADISVPLCIAIFFYVLSEVIALWRAAARLGYSRERPILATYVMIGAFMFIVSDAILAINKFVTPLGHNWSFYGVMTTYWLAQTATFLGSPLDRSPPSVFCTNAEKTPLVADFN
eukprot:GCRY01001043.1.p1 GENE.GCRY01001043.1~~GCRY01001043.1.p1  ORF type:complete len:253 (-),score=20.76 GCRY01001043.1:30-788(-)